MHYNVSYAYAKFCYYFTYRILCSKKIIICFFFFCNSICFKKCILLLLEYLICNNTNITIARYVHITLFVYSNTSETTTAKKPIREDTVFNIE